MNPRKAGKDEVAEGTAPTRAPLTKREHFASLAMQGDWAARVVSNHIDADEFAKRAKLYVLAADALIKELSGEPDDDTE